MQDGRGKRKEQMGDVRPMGDGRSLPFVEVLASIFIAAGGLPSSI